MDLKKVILTIIAIATLLLTAGGALAFSGFPARDYPFNQYGHQATYYSGPWGERMVYGGYGYFPNWNGNYPYGYRSYGYMYTPWDMRNGNTMGGYGSRAW